MLINKDSCRLAGVRKRIRDSRRYVWLGNLSFKKIENGAIAFSNYGQHFCCCVGDLDNFKTRWSPNYPVITFDS